MSAKKGTAAGSDGVPFEFFIGLPDNWRLYLLSLFNKIMITGYTPDDWSLVIMCLLHKKGPLDDLSNYRGIALVNCILKLFTQIIQERLLAWVEVTSSLPEVQSGFRRGRGCMDNVFSLMAGVHFQLRLKGRRVYAAFVDFRRAFDSLDHNLLWQKLFKLGVSSQTIRILASLYDKASFKVKCVDGLSKTFQLTTGVLQGECLSPLLFALFVSDIEDFFRNNGARGINIDGHNDLIVLLYADDLVLLSDSQIGLQKDLQLLESYTVSNGLTVNVQKTKVVCFSRSGYIPRDANFHYGTENIEIVRSFWYLGVEFSSSSLFLTMSRSMVARVKSSFGAVLSMLGKGEGAPWPAVLELYNAIVRGAIQHCLPVWGLRYTDVLERCQVSFFKYYLKLPRTTPDAVVRLEVGITHLKFLIFSQALSWLIKILSLNDSRMPKICLNRMLELDNVESRYNWAAQMKATLYELDFAHVWSNLSYSTLKNNKTAILRKLRQNLQQEDLEAISNLRYCLLYRELCSHPAYDNHYLFLNIAPIFKKTICQMRCCYRGFLRIVLHGDTHMIKFDEKCLICNLQTNETLAHFLFVCPIYKPLRTECFRCLSAAGRLESALANPTVETMKSVTRYLTSALRLRSFALNE